MMKTTTKLILSATALPLILATTAAYAYDGKNSKDMDCHRGDSVGFNLHLIRQLDLTEEQKNQLRDLREAKKEQRKTLRKEHKETHKAAKQTQRAAVQDLVLAKDFDPIKAEELAKVMVEKQTEHRVTMLAEQHAMLSMLTEEQKADLQALQAEHMAKKQNKKYQKTQ